MKRSCMSLALLLLTTCGGGGSGGPTAGLYQLVNAFPALSFSSPLFLTYAPGDPTRVFVVEQRGTIQVFENNPAVATMAEFLDIQARVDAGGEQGLLGLAFDPDYANNGFFYVNYTSGSGGLHTVVSRFQVTANPEVADDTSETILLQFDQPFSNHNGGWIGFGEDGHLYIASGDGGSGGDPSGNGQSLTTVLGKILRITTAGGIPADNPFVGMGGGVRGEIWAYGLRNPWRAGFDRANGDLWCGDVGQGDREEVDLIVRGGNYGWDLFEGNREYDNPDNIDIDTTERPVIDYGRGQGSTVVGGYVYRGPGVPTLAGHYVYADFGSGRIWALLWNGSSVVSNTEIASVGAPASFGEDFAGELHICSFDGNIYRLEELP